MDERIGNINFKNPLKPSVLENLLFQDQETRYCALTWIQMEERGK